MADRVMDDAEYLRRLKKLRPRAGKRAPLETLPPGSSVLDVPVGGTKRIPDTVLRRRPEPEDTITGLNPSMAQRHAEKIEQFLSPRSAGPKRLDDYQRGLARMVSQTLMGGDESLLPFGIGAQELVPFSPYVAEQSGEMVREGVETGSPLTTALGMGLGALQAYPVFKPIAKGVQAGAMAAGRAGERLAERVVPQVMERGGLGAEMLGALGTGSQSAVIKPKGLSGNWLANEVERQAKYLKDEPALSGDIIDEASGRKLFDEYRQSYEQDPTIGLHQWTRENYPDVYAKIQTPENAALNKWVDKKLTKYIKTEMGTPEDPVRALAEQGILHYEPMALDFGAVPSQLMKKRAAAGMPTPLMGKSDLARRWELTTDKAIDPSRARDWTGAPEWGLIDEAVQSENPWLSKVPEDTPVYTIKGLQVFNRDVGFEHLMDELYNAVRPDSNLPAHLRYSPKDLEKVTVPQAVERVAKINEYRANKKAEANAAIARNSATIPVKEYPEAKMTWVEFQPPKIEALPEDVTRRQMSTTQGGFDVPGIGYVAAKWDPKTGLDWAQAENDVRKLLGRKPLSEALDYEGDLMGHCAGRYCDDVISGNSRIYSLRDEKGNPKVTIEVKPGQVRTTHEDIDAIGKQATEEANSKNFASTTDYDLFYWPRVRELQMQLIEQKRKTIAPQIVQIKGSGKKDPGQRIRPEDSHLLPFIHDFVKSGTWSSVADLKNAGMTRLGDKYVANEEVAPLVAEARKFIDETPALERHRQAQKALDNYKGSVFSEDYTRLQKEAGETVHPDIPYTYIELKAIFDDPNAWDEGALGDNLERVNKLRQLLGGGNYAQGGFVQDTDALVQKLIQSGLSEEEALTQALRMAGAREEARMAGGGIAKALKGAAKAAKPLPQEARLNMARENAERVGQSANPYERSLQQGYEHGWSHGSTGDITHFRKDLLGETTGAQSAKRAFFFARNPQNPPEGVKVSKTAGADTASGYAHMGGSREYKEAMRNAKSAEARGNWDEYQRQIEKAEDLDIGQSRYLQDLTAKYGEVRDVMLDKVQNAIFNRQLPQAEAEALDAKVKAFMPYGWYNVYDNDQMNNLKRLIVQEAGEEKARPALEAMDKFMSVRNERALAENTTAGGNVMPVALRFKNPLVHDFGGESYRDVSYNDLLRQAQLEGRDAVLMKNTYDPGAGKAELVDIAAVFKPNQIRSKFAAFDPYNIDDSDILGVADPALLSAMAAGLAGVAVAGSKDSKPKKKEEGMAGGGLAKALKGAKKTIGNYQALPLQLPRAPALSTQEIAKTAERVARQQTGHHVRKPGDTKSLAGRSAKEVRQLEKMPYEIESMRAPDPDVVVPEELGQVRIALPGDITLADKILLSVDDLPIGSIQEGGPMYGAGKQIPEDPRFWASGKDVAQIFQNKVTDLANVFETPEILAQHMAMGHKATNFAQHFADANLKAIQASIPHPKAIERFNKIIRDGFPDKNPKTGERVQVTFPDFPGVENYEEAYDAMRKNPEMRKWFNDRMKKGDITEPLNFPSGKQIEYAIMEPELRNMEIGMSGLSVGRMKPGEGLRPSTHKTYSHDIPGVSLGRTRELVPTELAFPDASAHIRATKPAGSFTPTIQKLFPHQVVDEQYINELGEYYNKLRNIRGFKDGGAVGPEGAEDFIAQVQKKIASTKKMSNQNGHAVSR